jgi:hypothetical protein
VQEIRIRGTKTMGEAQRSLSPHRIDDPIQQEPLNTILEPRLGRLRLGGESAAFALEKKYRLAAIFGPPKFAMGK